MSTSWLLNLPQGWEMAGKRPHGALEAVKRSGPTALHVVCGRTPEELMGRINAADARERERGRRDDAPRSA